MNISREKILTGINSKELLQFLTLFGLAILIPSFFHIQWITGPFINAIFILTLFLLGVKKALLIAIVPSLIALSSGTLPAILAPIVPFIVGGNIIYILSIYYFNNQKQNYWLNILLASGLKFALIFFSAIVLAKIFTGSEMAVKVYQMMTFAQFYTAFLGGVIAKIFLKFLKYNFEK